MKKRPNIVFLLSDDQGAWAMHCAGTKELRTPNLDRIAREGMRMTSFFCASPVCSPARASILTGLMPSAHGVHDWLRSGNMDKEMCDRLGIQNPYSGYLDERKPIRYLDGFTAYTDLLADSGYACALSGKWHLGDSMSPQHGFPKERWLTIGKGGCFYYHADVIENGEIRMRDGEYSSTIFTDKAIGMLDELSQGPEPFYLSVHYNAPHSPWGAQHHPAEYIDMYENCAFESVPDLPDHPDAIDKAAVYGRLAGERQDRPPKPQPVHGTPQRHENLRGYFAAITAMDAEIGKLLDALDEKGLSEDTVVIFTADNGMSMGHHGIWGKGNGTFPFNMYDTAVKVPFLIRWPGTVAPGSVSDAMVSACDIFPTIADMAGIQAPENPLRPGRSLLPVLRGQEPEDDRAIVIFDEYGPVRMIRTREYKYVHRYPYGPHELYDLKADPGEEHNLYGDGAHADLVASMRSRLAEWFAKYADPALDGAHEGPTGYGQLDRAGSRTTKFEPYKLP